MSDIIHPSTVYFDAETHNALMLKAASSQRSFSTIVNEAVRNMLIEDEEDLAAFDERKNEPALSYDELLNDLKTHGKI